MKQTIIFLIFATTVMLGCKSNSDSKSKFDLPGMGGFNTKSNSSNTSNSGNWSKQYRQQMADDLGIYANKNGIPSNQVNDFTNCVLNSLEAKFPNENVDKQSAEAQNILQNCQKNYSGSQTNNTQTDNNYNHSSNNNSSQQWSLSDQQEFLGGCTPDAAKSLGQRGANDYCNCILQKLMQEYPNSKDVPGISQSHMMEIATGCRNNSN